MAKKQKKQLLDESVIRRFMTLGNLKPLTSNFVTRLNEMCDMEEEELDEAIPPPIEDEVPPMDDEVPVEDDLPIEEPEVEGGEGMVKKMVDAIADAIQGVSGVDITVSSEEGAPIEEPEMEEPIVGSEEEVEDEEIEETLKKAQVEVVEENELVGSVKEKNPVQKDMDLKALKEQKVIMEIAKRVAKRLVEEMIKKQTKTKGKK